MMDNSQFTITTAVSQLPCYNADNNEADIIQDSSFDFDGYVRTFNQL